MTPEQVKLVQDSFAQIVPIRERVAGLIYERLFALDPGLRPLFKGDMARQRSRLAVALAMIVHGLKNQAGIVPVLEELGRRHVSYGTTAAHYATLRQAVLAALSDALGDDFTPEVRDAWGEAYDWIAGVMQGAAGAWGRAAA